MALLVLVCGLPLGAIVSVPKPTTTCGTGSGGGQLRKHAGAIGEWSSSEVDNAAVIVATGKNLHLPSRAWVIAVATAMTESDLRNSDVATDHDSVGLFQQRPSQGWGTVAQLIDPVYASTKFYNALVKVKNWQTLPLTVAAQSVQKSGFPDRYAKFENDAAQVVAAVTGDATITSTGGPGNCVPDCPPVSASVDSAKAPCAAVGGIFQRAESWLTAWSGGPVPYLMSSAPDALFQGYRRDCSGYVSMTLGLPGPGMDTGALAAHSSKISKTELRPGDLMINPAPGGAGHVVLFHKWADTSMSNYYGYEQAGDGGTKHHKIPYPYYGTYFLAPYRYGRS
ncbi:hypothetical protein [Actinoplanes sp. NPDC051859]|uniref:hypothetical protein n=1 Tax=Actinoplanes sp. NPDC051859 TaxID=3363909 RepID=UPI0037A1C4EA